MFIFRTFLLLILMVLYNNAGYSVQKYHQCEERKENMKTEAIQGTRTLKMEANFWYC